MFEQELNDGRKQNVSSGGDKCEETKDDNVEDVQHECDGGEAVELERKVVE